MLATLSRVTTAGSFSTVEEIEDTSAFLSLRGEWNELLGASASDCLFLSWEWLFTWWKHLAGDRTLSILAIRCGDELVGLAPLARRRRNLLSGRVLPVLEFLGNGHAGSDYLDLIVRHGWEAAVRQMLPSHLADKGLLVAWTQLKRGNSFAADIAADLCQTGWKAAEAKTNVCPYILLAGESWESYLAKLGAEHRYNFHRKLRRLNRDYKVTLLRVSTRDECSESIDLLIAQHNRRWLDRGGSDAFHTAGLVAFHQEFSQVALQRGWLRLYVLHLNDRPVASLYGFLYEKTFYFYQSSFDITFEKYSVGLVTMGLTIQAAIREGTEEFDLLHGAEAYKSHWSHQSRELGRLELYPPGPVGWLCLASMTVARSSRQFVRSIQAHWPVS